MKLNTVKITIKKVLPNGKAVSVRIGTKRRFMSFLTHGNFKSLAISAQYPNGGINEYEGSDVQEAKQALEAFLE